MKTLLTLSISALALVAAAPAHAADPEISVFTWAGYEDPELFKPFVEKHGDVPTYAYFGDEEEAFQKLRAGFTADVSHPCSQSVVKWTNAGLLEPIDPEKLENWPNLMQKLKEMPGFVEDGKVWMVPAEWGATGLTYNTEQVPPEDAATLQSFADPKYQGRVTIGDNVDDAYALAFLATGIKDWSDVSDEELQAATDFLRRVHPNVVSYWQDANQLVQMMGSGQVVLSWAWNDGAARLQSEGYPVEFNRDTEEGSSTWVCGLVRLKGGSAPEEKVYDFIDAWLAPGTADYLVNAWWYGHSNEKGMAAVDEAAMETAGLEKFAEYTADSLVQGPMDAEQRERMIAEFEKIKAGF
jgi:spermidine/putrescine transport system substrate-binding protein